MSSRLGVAAASGLTAVGLGVAASKFAAESHDTAAAVCWAFAGIAALVTLVALFPSAWSLIFEFLFDMLFWWV